MPTLRDEPEWLTRALALGSATDTTPRPTLSPEEAEADEGLSEKQFQNDLIRFAKRNGWKCYHTYDSRKSQAGYPDLTMTRNGRLIFAELKSATGKTTAEQDDWLTAMRLVAAGTDHVQVFLWRPSMWEEIQEVLQ